MAFFDKIGEMAKNVGDKTGDMIEVTRLNSQISDAEKRIVEKKKEIGEYCWGQYIENLQIDTEVAKMCAAIKEDEALIAKTQAEIRSIKADKAAAPVVVEAGLLRCQECDTANPEGTKFCQQCGAKLEIPTPPAPVEVATCPGCGFQNPVGTRFCQECGKDMETLQGTLEPQPVVGLLSVEPGGPICPACGVINKEGNRFCMECGAALPITPAVEIHPGVSSGPVCPACGAVNKEGNRFCMECGAALPTALAAEILTEQPQEQETVGQTIETATVVAAVEEVLEPAVPTPTVCSSCGTVNRPGVKFCGECGARLEG